MPSFGGGVRPARKVLLCAWCPEPIDVGEEHHWWTWQDEGTVTTLRCHSDCEKPLRDSVDDIDQFFCEAEGPHQRGEGCRHRD